MAWHFVSSPCRLRMGTLWRDLCSDSRHKGNKISLVSQIRCDGWIFDISLCSSPRPSSPHNSNQYLNEGDYTEKRLSINLMRCWQGKTFEISLWLKDCISTQQQYDEVNQSLDVFSFMCALGWCILGLFCKLSKILLCTRCENTTKKNFLD